MKKRIFIAVAAAAVLVSVASYSHASEAPDVIKLKKNVEIPVNMVVNDVIVIYGNLTVSGRVEGYAVVVGGSLTVNPGAYIGGDAIVVGEISKDPASVVTGKITQVYVPRFIPPMVNMARWGWISFWVVLGIMALIGFIGLSILAIAFVPKHISTIALSLERSFPGMFLRGILWMALVIPIALLLLISIVGIVLIPLELFLVALAVIVGYIASAAFIGNRIFAASNRPARPIFSVIIGMISLFLIGFIPVVGAIVKSIFLIAGFGAVITSRMGNVRDGADIA